MRLVGHVHAVEEVSFQIARGETLALVGESGSGKSTIGRALMRLVEPSAGRIEIAGQVTSSLPRAALRRTRRDIHMVFQDPFASLNPRLTVGASIVEPLAIHEPQMRAPERRDRAAALLRRVGLSEDSLGRYPHQFSGGQRQRLCIARALCLGPKIIVADEPVSALDMSIQRQVTDLLLSLQEEFGLALLFIFHDMGVVERVSHRVAVMLAGQIVEIGPAHAVLRSPRHPYTERLLESVPSGDPGRWRLSSTLDPKEPRSAFRALDDPPPMPALVEVGPGHFAQV